MNKKLAFIVIAQLKKMVLKMAFRDKNVTVVGSNF
jgi:hypothetical protein